MNFSGWVAIPRSLLNNTHTGKLSNSEQLVFVTLMLLADAKTGSGHINAAALRAYLPELAYPAAKRILQSLQEKRFIYREITHASKKLYPYWVHGYQISGGQHSMCWINLAEVFAGKDVSAIRYDKAAPEPVPETMPEGVLEAMPDAEPNNNKDPNNYINKDPCSYPRNGERNSDLNGDHRDASRSESFGEGAVSERCADDDSSGERTDAPLPFGLEQRFDGVYTPSGVKVHPNVLHTLLERTK